MNDTITKYGLKYGPVAVIAVYLVYFLVNTVNGQLNKIIDLTEHSAIIHNDMLSVLKDIRDDSYTTTASDIRQSSLGSVR